MALDVNILKSSLTAIYSATSNTSNATILANAICNYLIPITPASTGVESGRPQMIATFNSFGNAPNGHIIALTNALPVYAAIIASGMSPAYSGTPPTIATLPDFTSLYKALTDAEASHADCANTIASAIHTWFSSGTATSNSDGTTVNWGAPVKVTAMQKLKNKLDQVVNVLSANDKKRTQDELNQIKGATEETAKDYKALKETELANNAVVSGPVNISDTEVLAGINNTPKQFRSAIGEKIIAAAVKDLGTQEHFDTTLDAANPTQRNYGGIPPKRPASENQKRGFTTGTKYQNILKAGRIDEMDKQVGLNNALIKQDGVYQGYYWCAAAVSSWWTEGGLGIPNGGAAVNNWKKYGQQKGIYTKTPILGSAIVFFGGGYGAGHIGIVAGVVVGKDGQPAKILTIEGNTSGPRAKFPNNRNGGVVAYKSLSANSKVIDGYVNPTTK